MPPFFAKSTIGQPFIELAEVASTNIYAMEQIQANLAAHGSAYFALSQTAGKGQHGKSWIAEPGANITLSVVLDCTSFSITQLFELSLTIALACYDLFSKYGGGETALKWPNDIYWRDRKAGGILIENVIRGNEWHWSVVGIGINTNQVSYPDLLKNPVSLKQITGKDFDTRLLARELCACIQTRCAQWMNDGAAALLENYNKVLFKRGEPVSFRKDNILFRGIVKEVNAAGELVLDGPLQEKYRFGELEWVL